MISFKKYAFFLTALIFSVELSSCGAAKKEKNNIKLPGYSEIIALKSKQEDSYIYSVDGKSLIQTEKIGAVSEINYNNISGFYAYLKDIGLGNSLRHNNIDILTKGGENIINNFFSASDMRLSPDAGKLAFRAYKNDSLQSAEGMVIYDISKGRYLNLKSKILISGNLYRWLSKDEVMYYGISKDGNSNGEIYKYNLITNNEIQVLKDIEGYCTFFIPVGDNILYIEKNQNNSKLCYYNTKSDKKNIISSDIGDIWDAVPDYKHNSVYFIGSRINEPYCSIYKITLDDLVVQRITFDFPKNVEKSGGIALSAEGILYFCGVNEDVADSKDDVYSFDIQDSSINIISSRTDSGIYKVFYSNSNFKQP